ncbi:MAG: N-acetylmuramoyl-L-alanine amidase [bacterium]
MIFPTRVGGMAAGGPRSAITIAALCILLLQTTFSFSQGKPLTVITENRQSAATPISSLTSGNHVYASIKDLASALSMTVEESHRSLEIKNSARRITFVANNPFISLTEKGNSKAFVRQLPSRVLHIGTSWYIPVAVVAPMFESIFGTPAAYDAASNTLSVGKSKIPKSPFDVTSVRLETKTNGLLIRVGISRPSIKFEHFFKQDGWLYITITNAKGDVAAINKIPPTGVVKKIVAIQSPTSLQLTFKLDDRILSVDAVQDTYSNEILFSVRGAGDAIMSSDERKRAIALAEQRKRYDLDVIVLDAGHGGKDPGAIGLGGTKEKDVALGIVLKLGKLIDKELKDVKVVYTRSDDTFIELDRRGQIANNANGKLFISVHCNSMPRKPWPSRGFAVYLLRPGRTDEAINIAERENSVIELEEGYQKRYQKLTDENFILVTMAQTAHMRASETFAEITSKEMDNHLDIPNMGVKQAGFLVLVGSAMPNVLIETAYLSNRQDEKLLKSESGQHKFAEAIFKGIKKYKEEYEKLLQEGKDFGGQ